LSSWRCSIVADISLAEVKSTLTRVVEEFPVEQQSGVLDFALFIKTRQLSGHPPAQRLEDLWGDFWPEGEAVDDFVGAVRRWRNDDLSLHKGIA
jgi:hypothetical protein